MSVVVTRLVEAGLVARDRDARDARRLVLTLTKAGVAAVRRSAPAAQERILEIVESMSAAERKRFADTFEHLVGELGVEKGIPPMLFEDDAGDGIRRLKKAR